MSEKNTIFIINILKNIISVYFDTFFVLYFFKVANYEIVPLAKYYLTLYISVGIGFFLIRNAMKKNIKVLYFRIGISLQAVYIALIMLLKEQIVNHIFFVGFIKGIADGFYWYPKNLLDTEKVSNEGRQKFDGLVNIINQLISVVIPLLLGVLLTYFNYTEVGKIFFVCFIIMFLASFKLKEDTYVDKKIDIKGFKTLVKNNKNIRLSMLNPLFSGLTYSSGVMGLIITLSKINNFKTNLNLGFVDSICAGLSLLVCTIFMLRLKEDKFKKALIFSGIISFIVMLIFSFYPTRLALILYLLIRCSFIVLINKICSVVVTNLSNCKELNTEYKAEYYLFRDIIYSISRSFGYTLLFLTCYFIGVQYINYLMIICALSILLEAISVAKLCKTKN